MSAPNAGRQSPDPAKQSGEQGKDTHGTDSVDDPQSGGVVVGLEADAEPELESNPEGPLEQAAKDKVSKEGRGGL